MDSSTERAELDLLLDDRGLMRTIPALWLTGRRSVRFSSNTTDHVGMALAGYAGYTTGDEMYPSVATLAHDTGLSVRQVSRAMKDLRDHSLIYQTQRGFSVKCADGSVKATPSKHVLTWPVAFLHLLDPRKASDTEACALVAGACGCPGASTGSQ